MPEKEILVRYNLKTLMGREASSFNFCNPEFELLPQKPNYDI